MNIYSYEVTVATADSRARGDRLKNLYFLCKSQKTVSTKKLMRLINELSDGEKLDAIHFRALADKIKRIENAAR